MKYAPAALAILALCALGPFSPASAGQSHAGTLRVGPIRINCFTTPCPPWNAMTISPGTEMPGPHPLYLGPMPKLSGPKVATQRLARAWRGKGCLIIRGRLDQSRRPARLKVERILRACWSHRAPKATRVGRNTYGVLSDELYQKLPKGWKVSLSNEVYEAVDGKVYEGTGIPPDVRIALTSGKDFDGQLRRDFDAGLAEARKVVDGSARCD